MKHAPILTLLLASFAGLFMLLPPAVHAWLYFDHQLLSQGHYWGLVTGHWLHADLEHMTWNVAALVVLASIIEARSRRLLLWSLVFGTASVDLLLLSPLSDIQRYCGLSGILNTLLGVAVYLYWRETRSPLVILIGALSLIKIVLEMLVEQSMFTEISWPPFAMAHLAGILATPLAIGWFYGSPRNDQYFPCILATRKSTPAFTFGTR